MTFFAFHYFLIYFNTHLLNFGNEKNKYMTAIK